MNLYNQIFGQNKTVNLIFNNFIPVTQKLFKQYVIDNYKCVHYTDERHLDSIIALQNTKKTISCTKTVNSRLFNDGIGTQGGICVTLIGKRLLQSAKDLMSYIDQAGRRWFDIRKLLLNSKYEKEFMQLYFSHFIKIILRFDHFKKQIICTLRNSLKRL